MRSQKYLFFSLLGNILLPGLVARLLTRPPSQSSPDLAPPASAEAASPEAKEIAQAPASNDFNWSQQVEASDYPTYIANLRRIHCPQQTVRDIITADVDALYAPRRAPLQREQRRLAAKAWAPPSTSGPEPSELLKKLQDEEDTVLTSLLGPSPQQASGSTNGQGDGSQFSLPLAFLNMDTSTLGLNPHQQKALIDLRRSFAYEMGRDGNATDSPEDAQHWQVMETWLDKSLRAQLGDPKYQELESLALNGQPASPR